VLKANGLTGVPVSIFFAYQLQVLVAASLHGNRFNRSAYITGHKKSRDKINFPFLVQNCSFNCLPVQRTTIYFMKVVQNSTVYFIGSF
jgi:hypothetical protein